MFLIEVYKQLSLIYKLNFHHKYGKICTLKGAVSAFWGISQISKSFVLIDLLLDKDYSDMHKHAKNAILADF